MENLYTSRVRLKGGDVGGVKGWSERVEMGVG